MANNRMMIVCNQCYPTDEDLKYPLDVAYIGKWYPGDSYHTRDDLTLGATINQYLDKHAHGVYPDENIDMVQNENPVRLTYDIWVRDMPAIKKWKYEPPTKSEETK